MYNLTMEEMKQKGIEAKSTATPSAIKGTGSAQALRFSRVANREPDRRSCGPFISRAPARRLVSIHRAQHETAIPEWGGQKIYVMAEDDAYLTPTATLSPPRQTEST